MQRRLLLAALLLAGPAVPALALPAPSLAPAQDAGTSSDELPASVAAAVARADQDLDAIAAVPAAERTFDNTVRAFDDAQARFFQTAQISAFLAEVSPDADVRAAGRRARAAIDDFFATVTKRADVYRSIRGFADTKPALEGEDARLLEFVLRDFRRDGMALSAEDRDRLLAVDRAINEKSLAFRQNIADDHTTLYLTADDLAGVPEGWLATFERMADLYVVPLNESTIGRLLTTCSNAATREKAAIAYSNRAAPENVTLLEEILKLRHDKAQILGYPTIAHYETEVRMAKNPETVFAFYEDLRPRLREKALADTAELEDVKRKDTGDPEAKLQAWDVSYYEEKLREEKYSVDSEVVRQYFPLQAVTEGLFGITQKLYGLHYQEVTDEAETRGLPPVWHPDAHLYAVTDQASGKLLGYFYIDLFPRPNKYSHAAKFTIRPRKVWEDGSVTLPVAALVCNFTKPTADAPSLLSHREVETFFHEFGHCLHEILTEASYVEFSGTQVARDFVEAPSQMFQEWVWDPGVLKTFARHYQTGEPIPEKLVDGLVAARNLGSGISTEGQVFLGMLDMAYHTDPDGVVDTTAVRAKVYADTRLFPPIENLPGQASFGHLIGYDAGYYGYLWSKVYAADMAARFRKEGFLNPATGAAFRKAVLSRGGTEDELQMVRDFLGREPNNDAFLADLGLSG